MKRDSYKHTHGLNDKKPLEIYLFTDPFCSECWALSPVIKKLQLQYGEYFTLKFVLCAELSVLNNHKKNDKSRPASRTGLSCSGDVWLDRPMSSPYLAAISIKAAELQGKRAGIRYLRRLQEMLFMEEANISDIEVLEKCAVHVGLDAAEFVRDVFSPSAAKAFQCDLTITAEMEVSELPAIVFFNENIEDEGLKVTGLYSYDIYVQILTELLERRPLPSDVPPLEHFLTYNTIVASQDLAVIYDMPLQHVERQMKKLQLQRKVRRVPAANGTYWQYNTT